MLCLEQRLAEERCLERQQKADHERLVRAVRRDVRQAGNGRRPDLRLLSLGRRLTRRPVVQAQQL